MSKEEKEKISLVIIGHVDHGKSTLMGRVLTLTGAIKDAELTKLESEGIRLGKESFKYAFVFDIAKEERKRGLTIQLAHREFETEKYGFIIIDAPGHKDFIKNMITGTSQADAAVLVVSAKSGEFEVGIESGVKAGKRLGQTREHAFLAYSFGVNQLVVAINKMDDVTVNWSEERYGQVKEGVASLLQEIGYDMSRVHFLPISGWTGDNLVKPSEKLPWYTGPTFLESLDLLQVPVKPIAKSLRIPIESIYKPTGVGFVFCGRVETGVLKVGDAITIQPSGVTGPVKSIEMFHKSLREATPGDNIGIKAKGVSPKDVKVGYVVGHKENPPTVSREFLAQIHVLDPTAVITPGYTPAVYVHTARVPCKFEELIQKIDSRTGQVTEKIPSYVRRGESALVRMIAVKPLVIEEFSKFPRLGRFAIRDVRGTVAVGIVKKILSEAN